MRRLWFVTRDDWEGEGCKELQAVRAISPQRISNSSFRCNVLAFHIKGMVQMNLIVPNKLNNAKRLAEATQN